MPTAPPTFRPSHQPSRIEQRRGYDRVRRTTKPWRAWYNLALWRGPHGLRLAQLRREPLCERCSSLGLVVPADTVNHRDAVDGVWDRFVDPANHESLCAHCHDSDVQAEERAARAIGRSISRGG